jgi:hypothetical protein
VDTTLLVAEKLDVADAMQLKPTHLPVGQGADGQCQAVLHHFSDQQHFD